MAIIRQGKPFLNNECLQSLSNVVVERQFLKGQQAKCLRGIETSFKVHQDNSLSQVGSFEHETKLVGDVYCVDDLMVEGKCNPKIILIVDLFIAKSGLFILR